MANRETLLDLARRCEEASDGSDALDLAITEATTGQPVGHRQTYVPVTRSLDAAMTLVTTGCTEGGMTWEPEGCRVELQMPTQVCSGTGATPAIALTAAALRALAAMEW